ncbi:MAG: tetratricopeptide repeat protein [bacterium]|nr:tetratricopeptide repeat protein [bacterium]
MKAPYTTSADESTCWEAIAECRKVKELYPNASRYDLARSALMEVESFCRFDNETTVIELGKQVIATYPDQRKVACYAQHLIARAYEKLGDYAKALEGYQTLIDTYTEADNITTGDDLIAMALFRKAKCLLTLDRTDEAKKALQEIIEKHSQSSMVLGAKQELKLLQEGVIVLTEEEMQHLIGAGEPCFCFNWCGINGCVCPRGCDCPSQTCRCGYVLCGHTCTYNCSCPKACNYCGCSNCARSCPCGYSGCPPCPVYYPLCNDPERACGSGFWKCLVRCPCAGNCPNSPNSCQPCNNLGKRCKPLFCGCSYCPCAPVCSMYEGSICGIG